MPNINTINGLVLCDETNVNGVTIANITNIDGITKSCETCTANGPVSLGPGATCALACAETHCDDYYTDGDPGTCPLVDGDHLYSDTECSCVEPGYYSPKQCGRGGCDYCYLVSGDDCTITVSECPEVSCNRLDFIYNSRDCRTACSFGECTSYYVDETIGCTLSIGTAIYTDEGCSECAPTGYYSTAYCDQACTWCYTFSQDLCQITRITRC